MEPSEFVGLQLPRILDILNIISLVSALIVVLTVLVLAVYDKKVIDRVTFRIQAGIALLDVIKHIVYIFSFVESDQLCETVGFLKIAIDVIYYFLNVSIAFNMQLMFLHGLSPNAYWELTYWAFSFIIGLGLTVPFWILGGFGRNHTFICVIKSGTPYTHFIMVYLSNGLGLLVLIYCLIVPVIVVIKLQWFSASFFKMKKHLRSKDRSAARKFNRTLNRLLIFSSLYPLSCFLSILGSSVIGISLGFWQYDTAFLVSWALIGRTSSGILNLIAFLFDPTLHRAVEKIIYDYRLRRIRSKAITDGPRTSLAYTLGRNPSRQGYTSTENHLVHSDGKGGVSVELKSSTTSIPAQTIMTSLPTHNYCDDDGEEAEVLTLNGDDDYGRANSYFKYI